MQAIVFDIKRYALHDGPGIRTAVYLKGCPLACPWCHNPEGRSPDPQLVFRANRCVRCGRCLEVCPHSAVMHSAECTLCGQCVQVCPSGAREQIGRATTVDEIMAVIEQDTLFYDESGGGATFSGGEPLWQPEALIALLQACREREIHTAVDTCGFAPAAVLRAVSPYADLFLYDLKLIDDAAHRQFTGVSNRPILDNLRWLSAESKAIIVRLPIIPGITDGDENIAGIGRLVASLENVRQVDLLPYHGIGVDKYQRLQMPYTLTETAPPPAERLAQITAELEKWGLAVTIGG